MFLSSSTAIHPGVFLLTLGATCRYAIQSESGSLILSDPGASIHIPALHDRLQRLSLRADAITHALVTHLHADRISGLGLLRRYAPNLKVVGSAQMANQLRSGDFKEALWAEDQRLSKTHTAAISQPAITFSEFQEALRIDCELTDGEKLPLSDDSSIECLWTPGHTSLSLTYLVRPCGIAIVDETFGYYRLRDVPAFGADYKIEKALESIQKLSARQISALGLPYHGTLTGELVTKHLRNLQQGYDDLALEYKAAKKRGLSKSEISTELLNTIYASSLSDPVLQRSLEGSLVAVVEQLR